MASLAGLSVEGLCLAAAPLGLGRATRARGEGAGRGCAVGDRVELVGLAARPEPNGSMGVVVVPTPAALRDSRCAVVLDGGPDDGSKPLLVKPANLIVLAGAAWN